MCLAFGRRNGIMNTQLTETFKMKNLISIAVLSSTIFCANAMDPADVLGRDLKLPGASWAGHVGIAYGPYFDEEPEQVFEALNAEKAVQLNTIDDFKSRSKYWGSRTGLTDNNNRTRWILAAARNQFNRCTEYTIFPQFKVATPDECGKFRCDTFVNYVYWQAGITLPTYKSALAIPLRVYNAFPYSEVARVSLRDLDDKELMTRLQTDGSPLTDDDKSYIYSKIMSEGITDQDRELYIDLIGTVGTPEMIDGLMETYRNSTSMKVKMMSLRSIGDLQSKYDDKSKLVEFFTKALYDNLTPRGAAPTIRALSRYSKDLDAHRAQINAQLGIINPDVAKMLAVKL